MCYSVYFLILLDTHIVAAQSRMHRLPMSKMAELISEIFWLQFYIMGISGEVVSVFITDQKKTVLVKLNPGCLFCMIAS